jgi:hypothetical protein
MVTRPSRVLPREGVITSEASSYSDAGKALYLKPNEREVNQPIKSYVCANRFYEHIEDQKAAAVSEFLNKRFVRWNHDIQNAT